MIDLKELEERVILAAVSTSETDMAERSLDELKELADTARGKDCRPCDPEPGKRSSGNLPGKRKTAGTAGDALRNRGLQA